MTTRTLREIHESRRRTFYVSEVFGAGEDFPFPGRLLFTVEATDPVDALNAYCDREGFAPYSSAYDERGGILPNLPPDAIVPYRWTADIASAPFTNTEIMAYTEEVIA